MKKVLKKSISLLLFFVMSVASLVGCTNTQESKNQDKTITVAVADTNGIKTMDATYSMTNILHYELIYEPLVVFGKDGKYEPGLAQSWDISKDGKEYTFHLRKNVKYSNGENFDADSVIFNTNRWKDNPNTTSVNVANKLKSVKKIDKYTVKFTFSENYYPYLNELSYPRPCRMMAKKSVDKDGKFKEPIGTGMWMVKSYKEGKETVLVPNPNYWGEKPKVDKLVIKVIKDGEARMMALQSGDVDYVAAPLSSENIKVAKGDNNIELIDRKGTMGYHLIFNYDNKVFKDKKVRQALNYAVDKESLVKNVLNNSGKAATGMFPTTVPYVSDANNKGYKYDLDKSKKLLKEAGYTDSNNDGILDKNGEKLELNLVFQNEEYPEWKPVCEYLQSEFTKVGVDLKLKLLDTNSYYDAIWTNRKYDMVIYRTYSDSWNPHGFLSGMYCKTGDTPRVAWNDETLDKKIVDTLKTTDEKDKQKKYDEIFKYMNDEAVCIPLYYPISTYGYNKTKVTNLVDAPTEYSLIDWSKIDISNK